jgi:plastocyanin
MKRLIPLAAAAVVLSAGAAFAGGIVNIDQKGLAFSEPTVTVNKGDILNFTNNDSTSHNILISGNGINLNSGLQQPGVAFKAPMVKEGTYSVMCGIHPKMKMTVVVR